MTPAEQFRAVNAAMRPLPTPTLWADRYTGAAIFACFALVPFLACLGA